MKRRRGREDRWWSITLGYLIAPFRFLAATIGGAVAGFFFQQVPRLIAAATGAAWVWITRRNGRYLLRGLPALMVGSAALILAAMASRSSADTLTDRYRGVAFSSYAGGDFNKAVVCFDRILSQGPGQPLDKEGLALTLLKMGQTERAVSIFNELAPLDRQGYPSAHLWQARTRLEKKELTKEDLQQAETHLVRVLQAEKGNPEAHALLGQICLGTNRVAEAVSHFSQSFRDIPRVRPFYLRALILTGDKVEARRQAEWILDDRKRLVQANIDNHAARLESADVATYLERFEEALAILRGGIAIADLPEYHRMIAQAYLVWSDVKSKELGETSDARFKLLELALAEDPSNLMLLERLFTMAKKEGGDAERVRSSLRQLVASGKATGTVHFALGIDAWERGNQDEARVHWDRAQSLSPQATMAANNMAWMLAHKEPPELDRALGLIDSALKERPGDVRFRGTRGHILRKMGRWKEALPDLQASLEIYRDNAETHVALTEVYEKVGAKEMAASHKAAAEKLLKGPILAPTPPAPKSPSPK